MVSKEKSTVKNVNTNFIPTYDAFISLQNV